MNFFSTKSIAWAWCILTLCCFCSCFEITEEIDLALDGSGHFRLTINASESKENLRQYVKLEEVEGVRVPTRLEIEQNLIKVKGLLSMVHGMSDVVIEKDFESFVFKISGSFANLKSLNKAIEQVTFGFDPSAVKHLENAEINLADNQLHRKFSFTNYHDPYEKMNTTGQFVMESARVRSILRLNRPIKKVSNPFARISPSNTSVMLKASLAELSSAKITLDNKISF